jgi:hypothetical protein
MTCTTDYDCGKWQTPSLVGEGHPILTKSQLSGSTINLMLGPQMGLDTKTDWPSVITWLFDFDLWQMSSSTGLKAPRAISKIWSWVLWDSEPRITVLARASSNLAVRQAKWQTHPLVREGAPHWQNRNCLTATKILPWAPEGDWHQYWLADWSLVIMRL